MKQYSFKALVLVLFSFLGIVKMATAQQTDFTLGVVLPEATNGLTPELLQKLSNKMTQIINNSGEAMMGYTNDFAVYPVLLEEETGVVEGGLQNMTVTTVELSLAVKQYAGNIVYNTLSKKLKGSGNNKALAIANAISQIKPADESYKLFITTAKTKIIQYFTANCNKIIQQATALAAKHDYEQSLSLLQSIPSNVGGCYATAQTKSLAIYKEAQALLCSKNIARAKAAIANNDFELAMNTLDQIAPDAACNKEVTVLIKQLEAKVEKKVQREYSLQEQSINAIREIGKAYYSSKASATRIIVK